jgi:HlyD family secretion protein
MRRLEDKLPPLVSLGLVALLLALPGCGFGKKKSPASESQQPRSIYALGHLEPATGIISISAVPGERLKELDPDVLVNQLVPANGILGLLTSYDVGRAQLQALMKKSELSEENRRHQIEVAKAQKIQAEASLAQATAKLEELQLQSMKLQTLETASQLATEEFSKLESLREGDPQLITAHQLSKQRNAMESSLNDFAIARDSYSSARVAAHKTVEAAKANIHVADLTLAQLREAHDRTAIEQEIAIARETLKRSLLLAPNAAATGLDVLNVKCEVDHKDTSSEGRGPFTILKVFLRPGEFITQTPILQVGDLNRMVCVAEVYEADVKDLQVGQKARIFSPAFAGKFADGIDPVTKERTGGLDGVIVQIGGIIGSPGLMNRNPLAPADRSVVEVRVQMDDPEAVAEAARRVGLQVTVEFARQPASEAPPTQ